jgi:hypothetical protein
MFAAQFPAEVIGVALIDASHEDQFSWKTATYWDVPVPANLPPQKRLPDIKRSDSARQLTDDMSRLPKWRAAVELENVAISDSVAQLRAAGPLPNVPLITARAVPGRGTGGRERIPVNNSIARNQHASCAFFVKHSEIAPPLPRPGTASQAR